MFCRCSSHGQCRVTPEQMFECRCYEGWDGPDCSVPLEKDCKDGKDNDKGEKMSIRRQKCENSTKFLQIKHRWLDWLRRPWMLFTSGLPTKSALRLSTKTNRYLAPKTTARNHSFVLRKDQISHWRGKPPKLCENGNIQRKVKSNEKVQTNFIVLVLSTFSSLPKTFGSLSIWLPND